MNTLNQPLSHSLRGLYAITPDDSSTPRLLGRVEQVLRGQPALLQYRNKQAAPALRETQARALSTLCGSAGVPLIINDDPQLAIRVGAAGVHLGATDGQLSAARFALGPKAIIGVSCYADLALAERAVADGASYIAFGSVFASSTKPHAPRASLELLAEASRRFATPVCAIGGISAANAAQVIDTGVDLVAIISGVFDAADPLQASLAFGRMFYRAAL